MNHRNPKTAKIILGLNLGLFCWMVSDNHSETVKYDEKQQTKNRHPIINCNKIQTLFGQTSENYFL